MQIGSTEALKARMEKCIVSDCKDCPYTDAQICDTAMTKDALEYIESLEERIAIMQESMETLEKRCNTLNALKQRCGHWVNKGKDIETHTMETFDAWSCSRCRYYIHGNGYPKWKYCPMCGTKMNEVSK